jgi:tetratricopeptide (TPR) repeat protein
MCHSNKISQSGRFIMDLLQLLWQKKYQMLKPYLLVCAAISLTACASTAPVQPIEQAVNQLEKAPVEAEEVEPLPLNSELVYYVLTAELAGQRGEISVATELYNKAASTIDSPALASRSTQVANFTRDKARINRALKRWLEVEPDNAEIYIMQAPFLIMNGDFDNLIQSTNKSVSLAPEKTKLILAKVADNLSELAPSENGLNVLQSIDAYKENNPDALFIYARLAAHYKQYELALPDIEKVLAQQVEREDALILKAEILQRQGKGSEALAVLKRPNSKHEASDDLLFAYAKLLGENGKTAEARELFEQLHAKLPKNEEILFALGLLGLEEKDGEVAKSYFSKLILMGDLGKQAAYFMGLAEVLEKNNEAALIWFASVPMDSSRYQAAQGRYINLLADDGQLEKARLHLKLVRSENPDQAEQYYISKGLF